MRRVIVVVLLLIGMLLLGQAEVQSAPGAADPLTLASIGFVVLAAFAVAELLGQAGLPKVTGYILSGFVLGPAFFPRVLEPAVVEQMGMFKTLAVGLIALTAGLELDAKDLLKLARTLLSTVGAKILIAAPLVGGALVAVELAWHPLGLDSSQAFGLALVFGALSLGTSPAIALAVVAESGAKGRLSELVLGAAVLKDLVVVVILAVCMAIAAAMTGGGEGLTGEVMIHVAEELGYSVLLGVGVGVLLHLYMRFIKAEMLLFVAALVLVVAEIAEAFHLELLLVFIVAGYVIGNHSRFAEELHHPLEMVSLPVFVVFFTTAGAAIDVETMTVQVLVVAGLMAVVRAGGFWLSSLIGNKIGDEGEGVRDNAWYSYLPQAGVTLSLVNIAATKVPALEANIRALGMAFVTINLLAGPLALRLGLTRAGDIPSNKPKQDEGPARSTEAPLLPTLVPLDPLSPPLERRRDELRGLVRSELERGISKLVQTWVGIRRQAFEGLDPASVPELVALAESPPRTDVSAMANELAALFERAANHPQALEITTQVPLETHWLEPEAEAEERLGPRLRRIWRRVRVRISPRARMRELPLRLIAREAYEPRLATLVLELFRTASRAEARLADAMRRRLEGRLAPEALPDTLDTILASFEQDCEANIASTVETSSRRMHLLLARIDSPAMPTRELDFSDAATGIERELRALLDEAERWPVIIDACWQSVEVSARIRRLDDRITSGREGLAGLAKARETVETVLGDFIRRLGAMRESLDDVESLDEGGVAALATHARALLPKPASKRLRQTEQRLRKLSDGRSVHQALREAAARDTGAKLIVGPELVIAAPVPSDARPRELDVRELIDGEIAARVLPAAEQALTSAAQQVSQAQQSATTMVGDVELLAEVYRRQDSKDATLDKLRAGLERVGGRCEELRDESLARLDEAHATLAAQFEGLGDRLAETLHAATGTGDPSTWVSRRTDRARRDLGRELERLRDALVAAWRHARDRAATIRAVLTSDYRLRSGLSLPSAAAIAKLVEADNRSELGSDYLALFLDQPIRDPRFFVANRELLKAINRAERSWQQRRQANAALVVGGPGTGKTSLLNVAALKLSTRHVIWLRDDREGVVEALAGELHCPAEYDAILHRLRERPRAVVIDDLDHHLPLDGSAVDELELLTRLIAETAQTCFWVVAANREMQQLLARHWPLRVGFSELFELGELDGEALASLILARHRISALELSFPLSRPRRALAGLLGEPSGQQRRYFANLARIADGNIRAALVEWCRTATVEDETLVLEHAARARSLPFVRQLPTTAIALLSLTTRFGPCTREDLGAAMLRSTTELERHLHFLVTAGLLDVDDQQRFGCPANVRDVLMPELVELAVLHQEGGRS